MDSLNKIADIVVTKLEQNLLSSGLYKKKLALQMVTDMAKEAGLRVRAELVDEAIEQAVVRLKCRQSFIYRISLSGPGRCLRQLRHWLLGSGRSAASSRVVTVYEPSPRSPRSARLPAKGGENWFLQPLSPMDHSRCSL